MSAREIYDKSIRQLPAIERLRLASLILDDLAATNVAELPLDVSDEWSDEDIADLSRLNARHANRSVPSEDTDA